MFRVVIILGLVLYGLCSMTTQGCDEPELSPDTFQCRCPQRWNELRANALIQRNPARLPECSGITKLRYPVEVYIMYIIAIRDMIVELEVI
jgi:hypothetical protein